jgi:hypothetical protein
MTLITEVFTADCCFSAKNSGLAVLFWGELS